MWIGYTRHKSCSVPDIGFLNLNTVDALWRPLRLDFQGVAPSSIGDNIAFMRLDDSLSKRQANADLGSGLSLRAAATAKKSGLRLHGHFDSGTGHRRHDGDFQRCKSDPVRASAVSACQPDHDDLVRRGGRLSHSANLPYLSRTGGAESVVRHDCSDEAMATYLHRRRSAGTIRGPERNCGH